MKIGFFTDSHFSLKNQNRLDNAFETCLNKLKEALNWFEYQKCAFILFGGDFFDRHRQLNYDLIYPIYDILDKNNVPVYYIMGNHDEMGFRWQTVQKSNIGFLSKLLGNKFQMINEKLETECCNVYVCHSGQNLYKTAQSIQKSQKVNIFLTHSELSDNNDVGNISLNMINNKNIDLVLSGHLHYGHDYQKNKYGISFYNPGSLLRVSRDDKDRQPKVAIINIEQFFGKREISLQEKVLKHSQGDNIFPEKQEQVIKVETDIVQSKYIESFKQFKKESKDIFEILEKVGKKNNIQESVLQLIKSYKDKKC